MKNRPVTVWVMQNDWNPLQLHNNYASEQEQGWSDEGYSLKNSSISSIPATIWLTNASNYHQCSSSHWRNRKSARLISWLWKMFIRTKTRNVAGVKKHQFIRATNPSGLRPEHIYAHIKTIKLLRKLLKGEILKFSSLLQ